MKRIEIINGPNLNLTGRREPEVYGTTTMEQYLEGLRSRYPDVQLGYYQSNVEGELIDRIQQVGYEADGLIVNLGGYSHTSVALRDVLLAVTAPAVEVHLSNIFAREDYRHHSLVTSACLGMITGLGLRGYELALQALI
ncbi:MAG: 3-dehydroquinate dehydratase [Bacteroidales bacterium]|nr:3-dehydroquinate dehydratase [Bacteroidales bacterium]